MAGSLRRIHKELMDIRAAPIDGLEVSYEDHNIFHWECKVHGSSDGPYKGGTFRFDLDLPEQFPFKPPSVTFKTKIYHPGIDEEGHICVPVLRDEWKPSVTLVSVLAIIKDKVNHPSPDDPFEPDIAVQLKNDKAKFLATAKEWTKKYAT